MSHYRLQAFLVKLICSKRKQYACFFLLSSCLALQQLLRLETRHLGTRETLQIPANQQVVYDIPALLMQNTVSNNTYSLVSVSLNQAIGNTGRSQLQDNARILRTVLITYNKKKYSFQVTQKHPYSNQNTYTQNTTQAKQNLQDTVSNMPASAMSYIRAVKPQEISNYT